MGEALGILLAVTDSVSMFEQGLLAFVVSVSSARTEFLRSFQQHHKRSAHWNSVGMTCHPPGLTHSLILGTIIVQDINKRVQITDPDPPNNCRQFDQNRLRIYPITRTLSFR